MRQVNISHPKSKFKPSVYLTWISESSLVLFFLLSLFSPYSRGEPPAPITTPDQEGLLSDNDPDLENLPEIEANTFDVKVIRRSNSNKIYLFETVSNHQPKTGRILLLKREGELFMAFRILKTYNERKAIAAKRIRRYKKHRILDDDETFLAVEKISDLTPPVPTSQDRADLKELEGKEGLKVLPFDPELDNTSTPAPEKDESPSQPDLDEPDNHLAVSIEESKTIDHYRHWLTAGFGFVKNAAPPSTGGSYYFSAGNVRYGLTLGKIIFFDSPKMQDSIAIEGGFYLYKAINFATAGDAYTILSFTGSLRYTIFFSESFGLFVYGGGLLGYVLSSAQSQSSALSALNSFIPGGGGGFLFQVGPSWYTRLDVGTDTVGLNLVLRF